MTLVLLFGQGRTGISKSGKTLAKTHVFFRHGSLILTHRIREDRWAGFILRIFRSFWPMQILRAASCWAMLSPFCACRPWFSDVLCAPVTPFPPSMHKCMGVSVGVGVCVHATHGQDYMPSFPNALMRLPSSTLTANLTCHMLTEASNTGASLWLHTPFETKCHVKYFLCRKKEVSTWKWCRALLRSLVSTCLAL